MEFYYLILGTSLAIVGALPIGTVNLAVIHTSLYDNTKKTLHTIAVAGIGEVILAIAVLYGSMEISTFLEKNAWIHLLVLVVFLGISFYILLFKKRIDAANTSNTRKGFIDSYIKGFFLAIINPPVVVYWITAITIANNYFIELHIKIPLVLIGLFFTGVYFGKTFILYLYSLWGKKIAKKSILASDKTSKSMGVIFLILAIFQGFKIWI